MSGLASKTEAVNVKLLSSSNHSSISLKGSILTNMVWFPSIPVPVDESHTIEASLLPGKIASSLFVAFAILSTNAYPIKTSVPLSGRS